MAQLNTARLSPEEEADGFALLFNGKDLNGWKIIGPAEGWEVQAGLLVCNGEGRGWIRPEDTYSDFVLRLAYRISAGGNSGIFVRTSEEGRPAYQGMEIQLYDVPHDPLTDKSNGAIYDAVTPTSDPARPAGHWNAVEVSCQGPMVRVIINGCEVVACNVDDHPALKGRLTSGYIGLQNHRSPISFRNVRLKK